ncbi:hypothetical protein IQ254_15535 [Nodosilinea sp. LEGE 07088]|uniref:hypothetical protein n=1 Tax=Nodosilinea sp. LEGE 07088 TaxID=2777968 RepID=UPI00187EA690|nr:hypothetical protein [Nodosilinea sp. LEGE 07088]MBE9138585.1 hypothetical protein [Nodosilinea sp. LEGE 07088]
MTFEDAILVIESALAPEQLTKLQKAILRHVWNDESYLKISFELQYNHGYIKDVGAGLWRLISDALGEKVKKHNLRTALARYQQRQTGSTWANAISPNQTKPGQGKPNHVLETSFFQSHLEESKTLWQWMMQEQRPVVAVFDVARLNKKSIETKPGDQAKAPIAGDFSSDNVLQDMLKSLEPELSSPPLEQPEVLITQLLEALSQRQCLLVFAA